MKELLFTSFSEKYSFYQETFEDEGVRIITVEFDGQSHYGGKIAIGDPSDEVDQMELLLDQMVLECKIDPNDIWSLGCK